MAKISIDIDGVKETLENIGYVISDYEERNNNGKNWQFKFTNSGACVTVYDTNNKKNSVVNGKYENGEKEALKEIVDLAKCNELQIDEANKSIVELINSHKEDYNYDFKREWHKNTGDLVHDILCLSNNTENEDAYLIIGVTDDYEAEGVDDWRKSNEVYDLLKSLHFAGGKIPHVEMKKIYYKYKKIDVLVCRSSSDVPFFLAERYKNVNEYQIYTRVGDTNTPINQNASYMDIEKLWRHHFFNAK